MKRTKRETYFVCRCDCGKEKIISRRSILSNRTKSCGCIKKKHGSSYKKLYNVWASAKKRCYDEAYYNYKNYGARGIIMCNEWLNDYSSFETWALSNGYKEGLFIDRVNVDGNYEPQNCRFITPKQSGNNRRNHTYLTYKGVTKNVTQWAEELNVSDAAIFGRLKKGWSIDKIFNRPFLGKIKHTFNDRSLTLKEWSKEVGIPYQTLVHRVGHSKWPLEKAITQPLEIHKRCLK